ncbi:MAG TPA: methyltransferase [Prolixibacteraceae bacterium]|nr:methyltransferase [Prolixibacteraceae bacterium]
MAHNAYFRFKQFTVIQEQAAHRVGTDGVLLGAWAPVENVSSILDIGTGTGVIALMLAQRSTALIDALEIEAGAIADASLNFQSSPWSHRLVLHPTSLQNFPAGKTYDCIVCNPPFFSRSFRSPNEKKTLARHAHSLTFEILTKEAAKRLEPRGSFCVIVPAEEEKHFQEKSLAAGLTPRRRTRVFPKPGAKAVRVLMEFGFSNDPEIADELTLETEVRHEYTLEALALFRDFYLKL